MPEGAPFLVYVPDQSDSGERPYDGQAGNPLGNYHH
jgi:hypothetical protein